MLTKLRGKEDSLGGIYIGSPDFDNSTGPTPLELAPWIRITDLPGDDHEQGDDDRFIEYPRVQVDFWLGKSLLPEISQIDSLIRKVMHDGNWERIYHDSYEDGDTPSLRMTTAYFQSLGLPV